MVSPIVLIVFVPIGVACGLAAAIGLAAMLLVKSNDIGEEEKEPDYIDHSSFVHHAMYDSESSMNYFDGEYK